MKNFTRRDFIKASALSACTLVVSTSLQGCGNSKDRATFEHGVASGDPLSDRVIIWTRVTPSKKTDTITLSYEVATDEKFTKIVRSGDANTNKDRDFTLKVDVQKLSANTKYFYRFKVGDTTSSIGKTKTLPLGDVSQVKMAVFSCANYTNGYFNAYMEASKIEDLDVTLHLGDYIYEYGMYKNDDLMAKKPAYATQDTKEIDRVLPKDNMMECIELDDYRKRYALYHTDKGLQAIHASSPMIVVWDDHEIANDTYKSGAENHTEGKEGLFSVRASRALKAYFEWLPIRPLADKKKIFRSFDFGNLVSLHMLETRLFARDKQLSYADYYKPKFDTTAFKADFLKTDRAMIGNEQLGWLQTNLAKSSATWQVLGQQVLMGKMNIPIEILENVAVLQNEKTTKEQKTAAKKQVNQKIAQLVAIKVRILKGDKTVTKEEKARLSNQLPYNLDAWDGYFVERENIFGLAKAMDKNLVVLAGDTHNSWASDLKDKDGNQIGVEFATTSVTSPGMEEYVGLETDKDAMQFEKAMEILIDNLKYFNANNRGFMVVTFTKEEAKASWHFIDSNKSVQYTTINSRKKSLKTLKGKANRKLV